MSNEIRPGDSANCLLTSAEPALSPERKLSVGPCRAIQTSSSEIKSGAAEALPSRSRRRVTGSGTCRRTLPVQVKQNRNSERHATFVRGCPFLGCAGCTMDRSGQYLGQSWQDFSLTGTVYSKSRRQSGYLDSTVFVIHLFSYT